MLNKLSAAIDKLPADTEETQELVETLTEAYNEITTIHQQREETIEKVIKIINEASKKVKQELDQMDELYNYELEELGEIVKYLS